MSVNVISKASVQFYLGGMIQGLVCLIWHSCFEHREDLAIMSEDLYDSTLLTR